MPPETSAFVVFVTVPDGVHAVKLSESLLQQRLAACVHIMPAGTSIYRWQGKIETAQEQTMIIKTAASQFPELEAAVRRLHPYEVPEIIALPIAVASEPYLTWLLNESI